MIEPKLVAHDEKNVLRPHSAGPRQASGSTMTGSRAGVTGGRLAGMLAGIPDEIAFVDDDSPDGTAP
jgi:hypothetical protein